VLKIFLAANDQFNDIAVPDQIKYIEILAA